MKPLSKLVTRDQFGPWLNDNLLNRQGVEIGTYRGEYAIQLAAHWQGHLVTVDPYDWPTDPTYIDGCRKDWANGGTAELDPEVVRAETAKKLKVFPRVSMIRSRSTDAARLFTDRSLDFVYIDGNHAEQAVRDDVAAWMPKVRPGGIFCGHDFHLRDDDLQKCGVLTVIWDLAEKLGRRPHVTQCTSWWFQL